LYSNINSLNLDNRIRIESNYTTRSGDRLADVAEIGSVRSGGKTASTSIGKKNKESSVRRKTKAGTMYGLKDKKDLMAKNESIAKSNNLEIKVNKIQQHNRIGS